MGHKILIVDDEKNTREGLRWALEAHAEEHVVLARVARGELERLEGPLYDTVAAAVGTAYVDKNIATWTAMQKVLDSGEHRPTHLRGWKPGKERRPC